MNKKLYIIIVVIVILAVVGLVWWGQKQEAPAMPETAQQMDTTEAIQDELAGINIGDVDAEFKDVDEALSGL